MGNVTLRDIAARAGVSAALVSNYLNRRPCARMTGETRKKIDAAVAELGYHGSSVARTLRTGKSNIIGYVVQTLRTEVSQNEMLAVFDAAAAENYQIFVAFSSTCEETLANIRMLTSRGCDAIIASGLFDGDFSARLCDSFSPLVILNIHPFAAIPGKLLRYDYGTAVRASIEYLRSKGHREIFYQTDLGNSPEQRRLAFIDVCGEDKVWNIRNPSLDDWRAFRRAHPGCTAMLHLNDFLAMRTIQSCRKLGLRVPEDLAVVGFDDIRAAECATPGLSSIRRPLEEAAACAVKALIARLNGGDFRLPESLPCRFIPRESI